MLPLEIESHLPATSSLAAGFPSNSCPRCLETTVSANIARARGSSTGPGGGPGAGMSGFGADLGLISAGGWKRSGTDLKGKFTSRAPLSMDRRRKRGAARLPLDGYSGAFEYYARLRKVKEHVESHISEDIPLREAARIAGIEEKYFSAFFHRKTGLCFKDWIAGVRVRRATEMMRARNYSITDVSMAVGFRDLRTFERAFKRRTGTTPQAFKSSVRPS